MSSLYAVIMAGGRGERFWPQSRNARPKQLLKLLAEASMLQQTVDRLKGLVAPENILVITNKDYVGAVKASVDLPEVNIIGEPVGRDTGPCVALAAALVRERGGTDAVMMLLPADHVINRIHDFQQTLHEVVSLTARFPRALFTIGIRPAYPATAYGYICCGQKIVDAPGSFFHSKGFREKPDLMTAEQFLAAGNYKWNSGIFIWKLQAIYDNFPLALKNLCDQTVAMLQNGRFEYDFPEFFAKQQKISIDYAVMEKAPEVVVAEARFDWDDLGSWTALRNQLAPDADGNIIKGEFRGLRTKNLIVCAEKNHLVAAMDVENLIIVNTPDVTLVCSDASDQKIKELLQNIPDSYK